MRIFKYTLDVTDTQIRHIPEGAKFLTAQRQHGNISVWAQIDPGAALVSREFYVVGTGHERADVNDADYIGTVQSYEGNLVFHIFVENEGARDARVYQRI